MTQPVARVTHAYEGELALFLVGVRLHRPWRLDVAGRVLAAMPRMLAELERNRRTTPPEGPEDLGFLGGRTLLDGRSPTVLTYWRSTDHLYRYAANPDRQHRPAWKAFYAYAARAPRAVTIWHETFAVPAGGHESIYGGPARFGLAGIAGVVPVARRGERARERLAG